MKRHCEWNQEAPAIACHPGLHGETVSANLMVTAVTRHRQWQMTYMYVYIYNYTYIYICKTDWAKVTVSARQYCSRQAWSHGAATRAGGGVGSGVAGGYRLVAHAADDALRAFFTDTAAALLNLFGHGLHSKSLQLFRRQRQTQQQARHCRSVSVDRVRQRLAASSINKLFATATQ